MRYQVSTVKHGRSNMIWRYFFKNNIDLVLIKDTMDRFVYPNILEKHIICEEKHD